MEVSEKVDTLESHEPRLGSPVAKARTRSSAVKSASASASERMSKVTMSSLGLSTDRCTDVLSTPSSLRRRYIVASCVQNSSTSRTG